MTKPTVRTFYAISYTLEDESSIHILSKGKSFQTIKFPKGTEVEIFVSKEPVLENK